MLANYDADAERPSAFEESSSTLLCDVSWPVVEGQLVQVAAVELEEIRRSACAAEWQDMLSKRRAPQVLQRVTAGDRKVEGTPMVVRLVDRGRLRQNSMRKISKRHTRNVRIQAVVCAGIRQTMTRPVVLAFQHTLMEQEGLKFYLLP